MGIARRMSRSIRRVVREATAKGRRGETHNVNVADPSNVVVIGNVGDDTSLHGSSTTQSVRIRQDGRETIEETETTESRF